MQEDQAIAEIREVRRRISEECDHDPLKLIAYYKKSYSYGIKSDCCGQKKVARSATAERATEDRTTFEP